MKEKSEVIAELQRVAKLIGLKSVSKRDFRKHGEMADSTVASVFGSWNRAIISAGLEPYTNTKQRGNKRRTTEADLLDLKQAYLRSLLAEGHKKTRIPSAFAGFHGC